MKFTVENATDSPEVNRLSQFVFDKANLSGEAREDMIGTLMYGESLGFIVSSATDYARIYNLSIPRELVADAVKAAADLGEPVPDYAMPFVEPYMCPDQQAPNQQPIPEQPCTDTIVRVCRRLMSAMQRLMRRTEPSWRRVATRDTKA